MGIGITSPGLLSSYYSMSSLVSDPSGNFSKIDTSGDGAIDEAELGTFMSRSMTQEGATPSVDDLYRTMDANGDGSVSKDEFTAYANARSQQLQIVLSTQQMMKNLELSLVQSIDGSGTKSTDNKTNVTDAAGAILGKYAENLNAATSKAISSIDVQA